jgi:glycosyltransferase involved in cell wall biosynthesis
MDPRILFIDHAGALGGAELYLLDVARAYQSTSTVLLFEEGPFLDRLKDEDIRVEVVSAPSALIHVQKEGSSSKAVYALPGLLSLAANVSRRAKDYDVIFANSQKSLVVAGLVRWWTQTPLVWNLHDMLTEDHFSPLNRWVATRWANWFADRVIVNSEATREAFVAQGGDGSKTGLAYNGIDAAPFDSVSSEEAHSTRQKLGLGSEVPVLGIFSRLARWKGQDVMIRALPEIPEAHLLLVGEALFGDDDIYKQELNALCSDLGVEDRVHFLGFRDDVPRLMKATDVLVHTSTAPEPFGRVVVEGMLARTPVIATRAGGPVEIVEDGVTGRLVSPDSPSLLANVLREVLENERETEQMVRNAYARAQSCFSVELMLEAVDGQIREAIC